MARQGAPLTILAQHGLWRPMFSVPPGNAPALIRDFIQRRLPVAPAPSLPEIRLHTGAPDSGLRRLAEATGEDASPYWAHAWAGGLVLARHVLDHPEVVAGRGVLDLGCGGGVVGIASAKAGATRVLAVDVDVAAIEAARLNAELNGVAIEAERRDAAGEAPPPVDLILAGDVFYDAAVAARVLPFLERCAAAGIEVLVGDPGRSPLPRDRLERIAEYPTPDFGTGDRPGRAWVFRLLRP